ncbi:hypothetical protein R3P38DRAFT_334936 [Favolaschia claudopus]|uniref:Serine-threonine/tyrosine-protein kinase catalytic domain-containing protein n=1 Tax=Favolaschia claudopus TaxID=2862362 RepID=A0AAV9ZLJ5_9AGAR
MAAPSEEIRGAKRVLDPDDHVSVQSLFYRARNLSISGGTFNFTTTTTVSPQFENFRRIPLGDLIVEQNLGVVEKLPRPGRNTITLHAAKIFGSTTPFTVAMYEGEDANEEWDKYIAIHSQLRHPNVLQLFGIATADGIYAAVFHEEYISFQHALESYTLTPAHVLYFFNFFEEQFIVHIFSFYSTESP